MSKIHWPALLVAIAIPEAVGALAGVLSGSGGELYTNLNQPPLSPPGWLFPVMWAILYALMGIASYLIWRSDDPGRKQALTLYVIQLAVNFIWPIIFFRWQLYWVAVVVILLLVVLVIATMRSFYAIDKRAAYLLIPYLLWLLFATYLNIGVAILN